MSIPDTPCMPYMLTLTPKTTPMIPYMECLGIIVSLFYTSQVAGHWNGCPFPPGRSRLQPRSSYRSVSGNNCCTPSGLASKPPPGVVGNGQTPFLVQPRHDPGPEPMQGSDPDMEGSGPSKPYGFEGPKGCLERLGSQCLRGLKRSQGIQIRWTSLKVLTRTHFLGFHSSSS